MYSNIKAYAKLYIFFLSFHSELDCLDLWHFRHNYLLAPLSYAIHASINCRKAWMQPNMHFLWTVCVLLSLIIHFNIYYTIILLFFLMIKSHLQLSSVILHPPSTRWAVYPEHKKHLFRSASEAIPMFDPHTLSLFLKQRTIIYITKEKILYSQALSAKSLQKENNLWTMHVKTYLRQVTPCTRHLSANSMRWDMQHYRIL